MRAFCGVRHAPSVGGERSCSIPTKREGKHELSTRLPQHCTGGALGNHADPAIKTREDFEKYPFDKVPALYAERFGPQFDALRAHMPEGMKAIGGVGNGVFEITQDLVGYENLMLLTYDDEELYSDLFKRVGAMMREIWSWFLRNYADVFCVCRFGDDLGYKSATLMAPDEIRGHIIPEYAKIVSLVHEAGRPFLLHSCGCIFDVLTTSSTSPGSTQSTPTRTRSRRFRAGWTSTAIGSAISAASTPTTLSARRTKSL